MSLWGCRTGYGYEAQRVAFLREMYKTERRAKLHSFFEEDPNEAPPSATMLMAPLPPPIEQTSRALWNRNKLPPIENAPTISPSHRPMMAPCTTSQMAFRVHQLRQSKGVGQTRGDMGRMRDKETEYREQVFKIWNITGLKQPAVFRP